MIREIRNILLCFLCLFVAGFPARAQQAKQFVDEGLAAFDRGDVNTAHKEIDLARPKQNTKTTGFLPEERIWIDELLQHGYLDIYREAAADPRGGVQYAAEVLPRAVAPGYQGLLDLTYATPLPTS